MSRRLSAAAGLIAVLSLVVVPSLSAVASTSRPAPAASAPRATSTPASHVIIARGDTLSALAAALHMPWPALYEYNRGRIGRNPNVLIPGMWLRVTAHPGKWMAKYRTHPYVPAPPPVVHSATQHYSSSGGGSSAPVSSSHVSPFGGSFQQCVISRESGGNSQVMNSSSHYGLYQFDIRTWVSGGGSAADFGHASVAEQNQVFASVYAARGTSPWAPYDGC